MNPLESTAVGSVPPQVYRKNDFILGEHVRHFEEEFAHAVGAAHGIGISSGDPRRWNCLSAPWGWGPAMTF